MRTLAIMLAIVAACGPSSRNPGSGDAGGGDCTEGAFQCSGTTWQVCQGGMWTTSVECPTACDNTLGCVQCVPGSMTCMNGDVATCDATGNPGGVTMQCTGSTLCENGACVDACMDAAVSRSYVGCEYWAVDLDNALEIADLQENASLFTACDLLPGATAATMMACYDPNDPNAGGGFGGPAVSGLCDPPNNSCPTNYSCQSEDVCVFDAQHSPFGIVVSNPQSKSVDVTVTAADGTSFTTTVAAGAVQALMPQSHSIPDQSMDGTGTQKKAYKVTSTLPIVAYQFNPLDNVNVFSNDASLLIPRTTWDLDYYGMAWQTLDNRSDPTPNIQDWYGYIAVVSYQDGTVVEVTPTAAVQASTTQTSIAAGTATMFTLNAFDVLNLEAVGGGDLSGSTVHAMNGTPIGVFGGHEAMEIAEATPPQPCPGCTPCCADHLEEMLFPTSTWGKTFAIARSKQRGNEPDYIRVMAQKPSTSVTFTPTVSASVAGDCTNLGPGQFCDVKIQGDTAIVASEPVQVGQYLESAIWQNPSSGQTVGTGGNGGDPSMAIAVPVEQFRTSYTILIPSSYDNNYLSISAPPTGGVFVDGTMQTMTSFANNTYRSTIVSLGATGGQHTITCPATCSVLVYGWSDAVSYMFAGGLDLKQIVVQ